MDDKDLERSQLMGVIGAGLIAALVTALGMPSSERPTAPVAVESGHVAAGGAATRPGAEAVKPPAPATAATP